MKTRGLLSAWAALLLLACAFRGSAQSVANASLSATIVIANTIEKQSDLEVVLPRRTAAQAGAANGFVIPAGFEISGRPLYSYGLIVSSGVALSRARPGLFVATSECGAAPGHVLSACGKDCFFVAGVLQPTPCGRITDIETGPLEVTLVYD